MPVEDDYAGVTEFGADPTKVSLDTIEQIKSEATLRAICAKKMLVSMMDHPKLGFVLILDQDDGSGGFAYADGANFIGD